MKGLTRALQAAAVCHWETGSSKICDYINTSNALMHYQ